MKIDNLHFKNKNWRVEEANECNKDEVDIVFVFAGIDVIKSYNHNVLLKKIYPNAHVVGASSSGNIIDDHISDYDAIATAVSFDNGNVEVNTIFLNHNNLKMQIL